MHSVNHRRVDLFDIVAKLSFMVEERERESDGGALFWLLWCVTLLHNKNGRREGDG